MLASSKMDMPLANAGPIRNGGMTCGIRFKKKKYSALLQLQPDKSRVRICEQKALHTRSASLGITTFLRSCISAQDLTLDTQLGYAASEQASFRYWNNIIRSPSNPLLFRLNSYIFISPPSYRSYSSLLIMSSVEALKTRD
ncbi:hypothetical protein DUI87_10966 [Hirundo rustica rustica]|uniref:Uncharacterized protein n=1 Tax=Hirundo rustica rustica TaxID=333673 RepID=A0A3M0KJJ6_HIRRU|nr:hypothetical protein DUI87_10966 [Hirundo rustica rustica]